SYHLIRYIPLYSRSDIHPFIHSSFYYSRDHRHLHSFPTRRSSDLTPTNANSFKLAAPPIYAALPVVSALAYSPDGKILAVSGYQDRKSTRLNSSHRTISYAVFCLKKKNIKI